jgi:hypothetical protein
LEQLISFYCYRGCVAVKRENVKSLLDISIELKQEFIEKKCHEYLLTNLIPQFVIGYRQIAEQYNYQDLYHAADEFINKNFDQVSVNDEFKKLSYEQISDLLSRNELRIKHEELVSLFLNRLSI